MKRVYVFGAVVAMAGALGILKTRTVVGGLVVACPSRNAARLRLLLWNSIRKAT